MACSSKTADRSVKRTEIWESGTLETYTCIWGTYDFAVFKVIVGHSVHFSQNDL